MTTIIVGTDLSENALSAARWAMGLASLIEGSRLHFAQVIANDDFELRQILSGNDRTGEVLDTRNALEQWVNQLDIGDIDYDFDVYVGRRTDKLREAVSKRDAQWLVIGKSGRGMLSKFFVGSTAQRLAFDPPCPVVLVHPDTDQWSMPLNIVSAEYLGESSREAALLAGQLLRRHEGTMKLVHIIGLPQSGPSIATGQTTLPETLTTFIDQARDLSQSELKELTAQLNLSMDDVEIRPGYPTPEILAATKSQQANLLVLGSHGRSRVMDFIMGDVGRNLVKRAPCTVLITPKAQKSDQ